MGGLDKGLQRCGDTTLVEQVLARLRPQVGALAVSANRHLDRYAALNLPVWPDLLDAADMGPLSGLLAGLTHATTPWLLTVPCDGPALPLDLLARLGAALERAPADIAIACTLEQGERRRHPVYGLWRVSLAPALADHLARGERRLDRWVAQQRGLEVVFDEAGDAAAFRNLNTLADLADYERGA
jgi:molybdenum cofactor guanylyltransferase